VCDICNKQFNDRAGIWRHKKKCLPPHQSPSDPTPLPDDVQIPTNIIIELINQNKEFKELLMQQNQTIIELSKHGQMNHNNIHSNNHNKTFNLQFFLNETCKDAMNMKDFIQSLQLNLTDLEKVGELGYAEGISRMFIKGLNSLEVTKRPIHCSDVKREIMHIKDEDKWEKYHSCQDDDMWKNIIRQITYKNIMLMDDWKKAHPGCTDYNSRQNDHYLKLMFESMGPTDDLAEKRDFAKIVRRVAENTIIDKSYITQI
jgi:hypothetical protein